MIKIKKDKEGATIEVSDKKGWKGDIYLLKLELVELSVALEKLLAKE